MTSSRLAWARLPSAGPSEGPRRTSRTDSQPGSMMKAADERPASRTRRRGRARWPRIAKRAAGASAAREGGQLVAQVVEPPRHLAAVGPLGRRLERRGQRRVAGPPASAGLPGGEHRPPAGPGVVGLGALQGHGRRGRVVEGEQGRGEGGRRARRVAHRGRRRQQRDLAPAALGPPGGGRSGGGDEGVDHGSSVAEPRRARAPGPRLCSPREPARAGVQPVPAPARRQPGRLAALGRRRPSPAPAPRTGRCCCRSATRRATGATSWPTSPSRTRRRPPS